MYGGIIVRNRVNNSCCLIAFCLIILVCSGLWSPSESRAQSQTLVIAASDWAPYTSPNLQHGGFLTEIVTTALRRVGYTPEVKFVPWKRAVNMTKYGDSDALLGASYTEERTAYFFYPTYAWKNYVFFFGRTGHGRQYKTDEELCPATIGIFRGSFYFDRLSLIPCLKLKEANTTRQSIQMAVAGRIDLLIDSKDAVDYTLQTELPEHKGAIEAVQPPVEVDKVYLVMSKQHSKHQQIAADFDRGIALIKADGTYQKILANHDITPVAEEAE